MGRSAGVALLAGVALDEALGDPARLHPVAGFGAAAAAAERVVYRPSRARGRRLRGGGGRAPPALAIAVQRRVGRRARAGRACLAATLGGRTLRRTALRMADLLDAGDLPAPAPWRPSLVARRPDGLGAGELARATVESLAENTADAVGGPLVWTAVAGAPGAVAYRAANTLDAMVGYRDERYRALRLGGGAPRRRAQLARRPAHAPRPPSPPRRWPAADARGRRRLAARRPSPPEPQRRPGRGRLRRRARRAPGRRQPLRRRDRAPAAPRRRPAAGHRRASAAPRRLSAGVGWLLAAALALVAGRRRWA